MNIRIVGLVVGVMMLGACSASTPVKQFTKGAELAFYDFTSPATFEEGLYGANVARLQIADGVYNLDISTSDNTLYYGQWGENLSNVIIDVETRQVSADLNTTYGVMCRARGAVGQSLKTEVTPEPADNTQIIAQPDAETTAEATVEATADATAEATIEATKEATAEATASADASTTQPENTANNGDGYLFMVQGSGRYAILRSQSRKVTPLVNWTTSTVINTGAAQNRIRAVCVDNYLALYVNDQFLADATDDTYSKGQIGLVGASASRTGMAVTFDNLAVNEAKSG